MDTVNPTNGLQSPVKAREFKRSKPALNGRSHNHSKKSKSDSRRLQELLNAMISAGNGDFSVRLPVGPGHTVLDQLARKFNETVERDELVTREIIRVEQAVRREGRMTERAMVPGAIGGVRRVISTEVRQQGHAEEVGKFGAGRTAEERQN